MAQICTGTHGFDSFPSLTEGIARGRLHLTQITGKDFGYDIKRWFDHLVLSKIYDAAGRTKPGNYPGIILTALENPEWLAAVNTAEAESTFETIRDELQRIQSARRNAERYWSGQERTCPKCETTFLSIKDRGQCTQCGFIFLASNPSANPEWWREYAE
ncbi:MAG: hypothetical protein AAFN77_11945 [Planctomycetota bacterium]